MIVKVHVCEPEESQNQEMWYKDVSTFSYSQCFDNPLSVNIGDIVEDDMGTRFKVLSRHWKWIKEDLDQTLPVIEFTVQRYIRRGKQNPFMI